MQRLGGSVRSFTSGQSSFLFDLQFGKEFKASFLNLLKIG